MVTLVREQQYHKRKSKVYFFLGRIIKKKKLLLHTVQFTHYTQHLEIVCSKHDFSYTFEMVTIWVDMGHTHHTHQCVINSTLKKILQFHMSRLNISTDVARVVPIKQTMIKCKAKGYLGGCCLLWDWVFNISYIYACVCMYICMYVRPNSSTFSDIKTT